MHSLPNLLCGLQLRPITLETTGRTSAPARAAARASRGGDWQRDESCRTLMQLDTTLSRRASPRGMTPTSPARPGQDAPIERPRWPKRLPESHARRLAHQTGLRGPEFADRSGLSQGGSLERESEAVALLERRAECQLAPKSLQRPLSRRTPPPRLIQSLDGHSRELRSSGASTTNSCKRPARSTRERGLRTEGSNRRLPTAPAAARSAARERRRLKLPDVLTIQVRTLRTTLGSGSLLQAVPPVSLRRSSSSSSAS